MDWILETEEERNSASWIQTVSRYDEGTAAGVRPLYEAFIYPKLSGHQRVLFVPPAYGSYDNRTVGNRLCCAPATRDGPNPPCAGNCTRALLQWAATCYDWARTDPRVVGLNPWHWGVWATPKVVKNDK